jgi:hypothetical protein
MAESANAKAPQNPALSIERMSCSVQYPNGRPSGWKASDFTAARKATLLSPRKPPAGGFRHSGKGLKGVDPLVAEVVLAVIVVSVAIVIFSQQSFLVQQRQPAIQSVFDCAFAGAHITDVIVAGSQGTVLIQNTGRMPINATLVVFDVLNNQRAVLTPQPATLEVGKLSSIRFDMSGIACESFGSAQVFTNCEIVRPGWSSPAKCA